MVGEKPVGSCMGEAVKVSEGFEATGGLPLGA